MNANDVSREGGIRGGENILIVDDDESVRILLQQALENAGYTACVAENGDAALRLYEQTRFDLVITDILMPERDGIETIIAMRALDPNLRIIAISGGGSRDDGTEFLQLARGMGAQRALRKPFKLEEILEAIRALLATDITKDG